MSTPQILRKGWNSIEPSDAGWTYVSFAVETLAAGESVTLPSNGQERAFVPLSGTAEASAAGQNWTFGGRPSVFAGLGHCLYLPRDTEVTLTASTDLEIAIAEAPATEKFAPVLVTPDDIDIELRGGGNASRQVGSLMLPGFPADRLHVIEVWTPGGNWSSYPPHKHEHDPTASRNSRRPTTTASEIPRTDGPCSGSTVPNGTSTSPRRCTTASFC